MGKEYSEMKKMDQSFCGVLDLELVVERQGE